MYEHKGTTAETTTISGMVNTSAAAASQYGGPLTLDDIQVYRNAWEAGTTPPPDNDTLPNWWETVKTAGGGEANISADTGNGTVSQGPPKHPCRYLILIDKLIKADIDWKSGVKEKMEEIQEVVCPGAADAGEVSSDLTASEYCERKNSPFSKTYIAKNGDTDTNTCLINDWTQIRELGIKYSNQYSEISETGCYDIVQLKGLGTYRGGTTVQRRIRKTFYRINYDCVADIWKYDDGGRQFVWEPMGDPFYYTPHQKTEYDRSSVDPSWNYGAEDPQISTTYKSSTRSDVETDKGLQSILTKDIDADVGKTYTPAQQTALKYLKNKRSNIVGKTEF